jgi:predicted phage tail protein
MLREIELGGALGARFGRSFRFDVESPAEAVRALCAQLPGFERHLIESGEHGVGYAVLLDDDCVSAEELRLPRKPAAPIRIMPVISGADSSWAVVLLGIVLIVASFWFAPAVAGAAGAAGSAAGGAGGAAAGGVLTLAQSQLLFSLGVSLTLTGVSSMLAASARVEQPNENDRHRPSTFYDGPVNTLAAGHCVPVGYGRVLVGGGQISGGISIA